ncbi:hypothetical protein Ancab_019450 [Ancistrocladus abbreviatus]
MAAPKLYGSVDSTATMRALASLFDHEVEFEFVAIDLKAGDHQTPSFLSLSPFGEVPIFQEGELTLFESRAIMRYISHSYPKPGKERVYMTPKMQGIVAAWIDVEDHHFNPPATKLIAELAQKPKKGLVADQAVVAEGATELSLVLDVYEERLTESEFLGGDKFTSADLTHLPNLHYLMATPMRKLFESRPHVNAWCSDILARPAWAKVVEMFDKY